MKIIFPLFAFFFLLISCSDNDDTTVIPQQSVSAKFNGELVVFDNIQVETENITDPITGYNYNDNIVTARVSSNPDKVIIFACEQGVIGSEEVWWFDYILIGETFKKKDGAFFTNIAESTTTKMRGTFGGTVKSIVTGEEIQVSEGRFDFTY